MAKKSLLSYILPPEDKIFFNLFNESSELCQQSAAFYSELIVKHDDPALFETARDFKRKSNKIFKLTLRQLNKSFITPLEREDIQHVAALLNKITKKIVKACLNLKVYRIKNCTEEMKEQAKALISITDELGQVTHQLKKVSDVHGITKSNIKMKELETQGDEILHRAMDDLFSGKYDAIDVIKYRDIYKEIETALDACFLVSDTVLNIVLKQS